MEDPTNKVRTRSIRRNYNDVEKQCKTNPSYERLEAIEILRIPKSFPQNELEDTAFNIFSKFNCN